MTNGWMLRLLLRAWLTTILGVRLLLRACWCWPFGHVLRTRKFWEKPDHTYWDESGHTVRFGYEVRCVLCLHVDQWNEMAATRYGGRLYRDRTVGWGWNGDAAPGSAPHPSPTPSTEGAP